MDDVVEVVSFSLAAAGLPSAFLVANEKLNAWLRVQSGFVCRALSVGDGGEWLDVVQWKSMEDAKQAGEKIMSELGDSDCMRMIDPCTVKMSHARLQLKA
jgi:hypothetical protein